MEVNRDVTRRDILYGVLKRMDEVIDSITLVPLRDRLRYLVDKRLRGELNKCDGCKLCQ